MYYALVDARGTCCATTFLAWGTLKQIADTIISECDVLIDSMDMTLEELEDEFYCEFEDYKKLCGCDNPTAEMISSFSFTLSDCTTDVGCLVEGYPALVKAFAEYTEDKLTLDMWELVPNIEETDDTLQRLDDELRLLNDEIGIDAEYEFFTEKEYDEDEEY